jgi:hypothetical protein
VEIRLELDLRPEDEGAIGGGSGGGEEACLSVEHVRIADSAVVVVEEVLRLGAEQELSPLQVEVGEAHALLQREVVGGVAGELIAVATDPRPLRTTNFPSPKKPPPWGESAKPMRGAMLLWSFWIGTTVLIGAKTLVGSTPGYVREFSGLERES